MEALDKIPLTGYVNGIAVGPKARFCVVAVGQEPKLGRWNRIAGARNRFGIIRLRTDEEIDADRDVEEGGDQEEVDQGDESSDDGSGSDSSEE
jgi:hypothetical protein